MFEEETSGTAVMKQRCMDPGRIPAVENTYQSIGLDRSTWLRHSSHPLQGNNALENTAAPCGAAAPFRTVAVSFDRASVRFVVVLTMRQGDSRCAGVTPRCAATLAFAALPGSASVV